jgi:hypothetical protein
MMTVALTLTMLMASIQPSRAADTNDGFWWKSADELYRLGYILGFGEGFEYGSAQEMFIGLKAGQLMETVTMLYQNPLNLRISVRIMVPVAAALIKGRITTADAEKWLEINRQVAAAPK